MVSQQHVLKLNKATGCYEATITIQVESELFRRILLQQLVEDEAADLTSPRTWEAVIARIGAIAFWLNKPMTKVIVREDVAIVPDIPLTPAANAKNGLNKAERRMERLRAAAYTVPPYRWQDECRTPIAPLTESKEERGRVGHLRDDERKDLLILYKQWQAGTFVLSPEAQAEQERHQQEVYEAEQERLSQQLEVVATGVNGERFH